MKKKYAIFWVLLCIEFLGCWRTTNIFFGNGWLTALLMMIGNFVFVKLCRQKFLEWFELQEDETFAIEKGVLSVTALQIVLFLAFTIWLQYSI